MTVAGHASVRDSLLWIVLFLPLNGQGRGLAAPRHPDGWPGAWGGPADFHKFFGGSQGVAVNQS